jgi:hypothetical protein
MSWKPEVQTDSTGQWYGNALRFATKLEAMANVANLSMRWFAVKDTRAVESDDPVNYRWDTEKGLVAVCEARVSDLLEAPDYTPLKDIPDDGLC